MSLVDGVMLNSDPTSHGLTIRWKFVCLQVKVKVCPIHGGEDHDRTRSNGGDLSPNNRVLLFQVPWLDKTGDGIATVFRVWQQLVLDWFVITLVVLWG